jgi:hypothetical protein
MRSIDHLIDIYLSGDHVEPGIYRDLATGAVVRIFEDDTLPEGIRIQRYVRLFRRVDEREQDVAGDRTRASASIH